VIRNGSISNSIGRRHSELWLGEVLNYEVASNVNIQADKPVNTGASRNLSRSQTGALVPRVRHVPVKGIQWHELL
jgi:hypothetical protein